MEEVLSLSFAQPFSSIPIAMSKAIDQSLGSSLKFKGWTYVTASITLMPEHLPMNSNLDFTAYLDTSCGVTFVEQNWLLKCLTHQKISTMSTLLKVRGIGVSKYKSAKFTALSSYFLGKNDAEELVYTALNCNIQLVKEFQVNLLIGNYILSQERVVIDIGRRSPFIGSCKIRITINAKQQGQFLARKLLARQESVVPPCSEAMVALHQVFLSDNRNFLFYPTIQANLLL